MTETLWQQLEDKIIALVAELERCRCELQHVKEEYAVLLGAQEHQHKRLRDLLILLDNSNTSNDNEIQRL